MRLVWSLMWCSWPLAGGPGSGQQHRLDDLLVAGAAAEVAGQTFLYLASGRPGDVGEQGLRREQLAGDAEPALRGASVRGTPAGGDEGDRRSRGLRRSSRVVPSASTPSMRQESTATSSTRTVQAPHSPTRQHSFVPVSPRSSRRTSRSVWCGAISIDRLRPLTVSSIRWLVMLRRPMLRSGARWRSRPPGARARAASPGGTRGWRASRSRDGLASAKRTSRRSHLGGIWGHADRRAGQSRR